MTSKTNWPEALPYITSSINRSPCVSLGYLAPAEVKSALDEPMVRNAQQQLAKKMTDKQQNRYFPKPNSFQDMIKASLKDDQPFHKGDFVYLDKIPKALAKGTDEKRGEIFIVSQVQKKIPVRYLLLNLKFEKVGTSYYTSNLRMVPEEFRPTSATSKYFE